MSIYKEVAMIAEAIIVTGVILLLVEILIILAVEVRIIPENFGLGMLLLATLVVVTWMYNKVSKIEDDEE